MSKPVTIALGIATIACVAILLATQHDRAGDPAAGITAPRVAAGIPAMSDTQRGLDSGASDAPNSDPPPADTTAPTSNTKPQLSDIVERLNAGDLMAQVANAGFQARAEEIEREQRGRARFEAGVASSGVKAKDIPQPVTRVFNSMDLVPELDGDGMLLALRIRSLDDDGPAHVAGLLVDDRITTINDTPLRDPADLPTLLANSTDTLRLCADRGGIQVCSDFPFE